MLKGTFKEIRNRLDYNAQGGAVLLGANKLIVKSHGSSGAEAFKASVVMAADMANANLTEAIKEKISAFVLTAENN